VTGDRERLSHIRDCITAVERYSARGRAAFDSDELIQGWIVLNIMIMGEAASKVSQAARARFPDVPWGLMIGMRNRLVHDYISINHEMVWNMAAHELPALRPVIEAAIAALDAPT
jgi:uncharacterized protein with HEPN domain